MNHKGFLLSLGAAVCFGLSTPFVKIAADNIPLAVFQVVVSGLSGIVLLGFHVATNRKAPWHMKKYWKEYLLIGVVSSIVPSVLVYWGYTYSFGVNTAVLLRFEVFVVLLFGIFFFHERIQKMQIVGVILGFFGVFIFVTKFQLQAFVFGDVLLLLGSAAYAVFPIMVKKLHHELSTTQLNLIRMGALFPVFFVGMFFQPVVIAEMLPYMPYLLFGGVFLVFIIGVSCYAAAVKYWDVWKVVFVAQFGSVLFGYGSSAVMLGERFELWQWVGTGIILAGIVLVLLPQNKKPPAPPLISSNSA